MILDNLDRDLSVLHFQPFGPKYNLTGEASSTDELPTFTSHPLLRQQFTTTR